MPPEEKYIEKQVTCYKCSTTWTARFPRDGIIIAFAADDPAEKTENFIKECPNPNCHALNSIPINKTELLG